MKHTYFTLVFYIYINQKQKLKFKNLLLKSFLSRYFETSELTFQSSNIYIYVIHIYNI